MSAITSIQLRPVTPQEAPILSALAEDSKGHWPYSPEQLALWREDLTVSAQLIASTQCWAALSASQIVGCFVLDPRAKPWSLEHFWVHPEHMGRGVGRALLERAVTLAQQGRVAEVSIDADPYAEAFYLACGAVRVGEITAPIAGAPQRVRPQLLLRV